MFPGSTMSFWSGRQDLNLRPLDPQLDDRESNYHSVFINLLEIFILRTQPILDTFRAS